MADLLRKLVPIDDDSLDYCASILPLDMISAGHDFLDDVPMQKDIDWDNGMIAVGVYRAMVAAAPPAPITDEQVEAAALAIAMLDGWKSLGAGSIYRTKARAALEAAQKV